MYDVVGVRFDGELEVIEEEVFDFFFENKFLFLVVFRYIVYVEVINFNFRVFVKGLECCVFGGIYFLRLILFR